MPEIEEFSALVGEIYDAALNPSLWPSVLESVCGAVSACCANLFTQDSVNTGANSLFTWGMDPVYFRLYVETYVHMNPLFPAAYFQEVGEVFTSLDVLPFAQLRKTRIYREWLRPQGALDNIGAILEKSATSYAMLALQLQEDQSPASEVTRERMRLIVPHIQRSILIGKVFDLQRAAIADFEGVVDALATAVYLINAEGLIVHANRRGMALLGSDEVLYGSQGRLRAQDQAANKALHALITAAGSGDDMAIGAHGSALHLPSRRGDHYVAHCLPLMSGARRKTGLAHRATIALFVHHAATNLASPPEVLAKAFGFTRRELAVLFAIVEVGAIAEASELLGLSQTTVKTHLRSVYSKANVTRQSELVKLVAGFMTPVRKA